MVKSLEQSGLFLYNTLAKEYQAINSAMVEAYWKIGEKIVSEVQNGQEKAEYGKAIITTIANELTNELAEVFLKET